MFRLKTQLWLFFIGLFFITLKTTACSILYYVDAKTGKIYVVNNEDYFLDVKAYIQIEPKSKKEFARLWYGWDKFAQGGVNEKGLFFDAAVTPEQEQIKGYKNPNNNLGDKILAHCATVQEALFFLEKEKIALNKSHLIFGDKTGNAVVVEWVGGQKKLHWIKNNRLIITNFLLTSPEAGNYPCYRFNSIEDRIANLENSNKEINLLSVGNTFGQAAQIPTKLENGKMGGTLYTSFINITDLTFFLSYKLSNQNVIKLDLNQVFKSTKRKKIKLKDLQL